MTDRQARILIVLLSLIAVFIAGAALKATYFVTMPLVFAFFVTVLVWPVHAGLQRRLPERLGWLSIVITMLLIVVVLGVFVGGSWYAIYRVVSSRMEQYVQDLSQQWQRAEAWLVERGLPMPTEDGGGQILGWAAQWAQSAVTGVVGLATAVILIVFFVLLMLIEAEHWKRKSRAAMNRERAAAVLDSVAATMTQVRTFILVQASISGLTAVVTALWLWIMGVPFVLLWTVLTFLVDFVPNVGPIVAGTIITIVALVTLGWVPAIITAVGILVIQQFFGNYIHPTLMGRRLSISPLVVLFSVIFWTWIWGPAGAVLAVPITATLIIACAHVPALGPFALLLSRTADQRKMIDQTHEDPRQARKAEQRLA